MYEFILWMCLAQGSACPMYNAVQHRVTIFPMHSMEECDKAWTESLKEPDPQGMKSYHVCQPVSEYL